MGWGWSSGGGGGRWRGRGKGLSWGDAPYVIPPWALPALLRGTASHLFEPVVFSSLPPLTHNHASPCFPHTCAPPCPPCSYEPNTLDINASEESYAWWLKVLDDQVCSERG